MSNRQLKSMAIVSLRWYSCICHFHYHSHSITVS